MTRASRAATISGGCPGSVSTRRLRGFRSCSGVALDETDRQLLNLIQTDFPLEERPYDTLGARLGIAADEAFSRVRALVESGVIRRIGPSFDSRRLGHVSALVAARVPSHRLEEVARAINAYPEVTHNYARRHDYNLWFTLVCESLSRLESVVERIKAEANISDMHVLPAERTFKIRVDMEF